MGLTSLEPAAPFQVPFLDVDEKNMRDTKKKRGCCTFCPSLQLKALALPSILGTSNAEAHAVFYINTQGRIGADAANLHKSDLYAPIGIYRCFVR
jgi:hypothetical protein